MQSENSIKILPKMVQHELKTALKFYLNGYNAKRKQQ
jgi:hypothetical protein